MSTNTFQESLGALYPELGPNLPDPDLYADSVIVRVLNTGPDSLCEHMLDYYGAEKVQSVAQARVNRLDAPVYRRWKTRLHLPDRPAGVERMHSLWRQ
jgi:hypothetical protein